MLNEGVVVRCVCVHSEREEDTEVNEGGVLGLVFHRQKCVCFLIQSIDIHTARLIWKAMWVCICVAVYFCLCIYTASTQH